MSQNIFDNEVFFEKYRELRSTEDNYNSLVEQPVIKALLPDLKGKAVLDLGCGYGNNCIDFIRKGAVAVVGVDISSKMLEVARIKNQHESVKYMHLDMNQIGSLTQKFDLVFSSLAFHYIEDFQRLLNDIRNLLNDNGILLFSQEHPYTTAPKGGAIWTKDESGNKIHYNLSDYMYSGKRYSRWFVDNVEKYHRPMSELLNSMISQGFVISNVVEPVPDEYALARRPDLKDEFDRTTCIIIKGTRN